MSVGAVGGLGHLIPLGLESQAVVIWVLGIKVPSSRKVLCILNYGDIFPPS